MILTVKPKSCSRLEILIHVQSNNRKSLVWNDSQMSGRICRFFLTNHFSAAYAAVADKSDQFTPGFARKKYLVLVIDANHGGGGPGILAATAAALGGSDLVIY